MESIRAEEEKLMQLNLKSTVMALLSWSCATIGMLKWTRWMQGEWSRLELPMSVNDSEYLDCTRRNVAARCGREQCSQCVHVYDIHMYDVNVRVHVILRASTSVKYGSGDVWESGEYTIKLLHHSYWKQFIEQLSSCGSNRVTISTGHNYKD